MSTDQNINNEGYTDEWNDYEPPSDKIRPPEPQEYTFMLSTEDGHFKKGVWYQSPETNRSVPPATPGAIPIAWFNFRGIIQGGEHDGRIAFGGCGTQTSQYRKGTTAQDYILACKSGLRPTSSQLVNEILNDKPSTLERIVGPFNARTNWQWRCQECDETFLVGFKNPKSPKKYKGNKLIVNKEKDGRTSHVQTCPECYAEISATLVMTGFIVPKDGKTAKGPARRVAAPAGLPPSAA